MSEFKITINDVDQDLVLDLLGRLSVKYEVVASSKKYYKVVRKGLSSVFGGKYRIVYKIGEWTFPVLQESKLFVFTDLAKALRFCDVELGVDGEIYECEVFDISEAEWCGPPNEPEMYWIGKRNYQLVPDYTIFASAVKLTKKVDA